MIDEIVITDLGVIANATLPLGPGFTAITGETGAGKTMLVTALGLLMGDRATAQTVRSGTDKARVAGVVVLDPSTRERVQDLVEELGGELEPVAGLSSDQGSDDDKAATRGPAELLISRTVTSEGRSRATIGGAQATAGSLAALAEHLFVVHGQSEQLRLKSSAEQRTALDRFGQHALLESAQAYRDTYAAWRASATELRDITSAREQRAREAAALEQELAEITGVDPQPGEDVVLNERIAKLGNVEALRQATALATAALSAESDAPSTFDVRQALTEAISQLERSAESDPSLRAIIELLHTAEFAVADAVGELHRYQASLDVDAAQDFELAQQRKAALTTLLRKYGPELADVISYAERGAARLTELHDDSSRVEELEQQVAELRRTLEAQAQQLTALRVEAARELSAAVTAELTQLALPEAQFVARVTPAAELGAHGADDVAFLLQPHPGAEPRPIQKGASGGELSRIMLALEVVIAAADPVPTFVFDEVDSGVGGAAALEVGRRLAKLAETAQVIVVTHLAQVAAFANNHVRVVKDSSGGFTESSLRRLDGEERIAEMARLLSGMQDSVSALEHANELLLLGASTR